MLIITYHISQKTRVAPSQLTFSFSQVSHQLLKSECLSLDARADVIGDSLSAPWVAAQKLSFEKTYLVELLLQRLRDGENRWRIPAHDQKNLSDNVIMSEPRKSKLRDPLRH